MLLVTFVDDQQPRVGLLDRLNDELVDVTKLFPSIPGTMLGLIAAGAEILPQLRDAVNRTDARISRKLVRLLAPIPNPLRNIICVGKNYRDHVHEVQSLKMQAASTSPDSIPAAPIFFTKATTSVIGPDEPIPASLDPTASTDYEGELGVIIGRTGRGISRHAAMQYVFGYTIINDVTSRRMQSRHQQWFLGKSLDGFCPMGPAILTADAVPDVSQLSIQTRVNDAVRQQTSVADMIFGIPELIESLSRGMTVLAGDIIATGTPAGVGMGMSPPRYLQAGDQISITIDRIGTLSNPVA